MRVYIADRRAAVRDALRLLVEQEPAGCVVGEAAHGAALLARLRDARADLLLLDWELPGCHGADLLARLSGDPARPRVLALSALPEARQEALAAGADGFHLKSDPPAYLLAALRALRAAV